MRKTFLRFACFAALTFAMAACQSDDNEVEDTQETPTEEGTASKDSVDSEEIDYSYTPIEMTATEAAIATRYGDFAFNYFRAVEESLSQDEQSQFVVSPLSASLALGMVANGAAGDTRQELINGLGLGDYGVDEMNGLNKKLAYDLPKQDGTATVSLANSVWVGEQFSLLESFVTSLSDNYNAEARQLTAATAAADINQWCAEKTNNLIQNLLSGIDEDTEVILLNTLYFKAAWRVPFKEKESEQGDFGNEDGTVSKVDFMQKTSSYPYVANEQCAVAELPYGNGAFSLYVVLPNEGNALKNCLEGMDGETWSGLRGKMTETMLSVRLPKFTIANKMQLAQAMGALGIRKMFGSGSDFSLMSEQAVFVSSMLQAASFSVDEKGTEAAAATVITNDGLSVGDDAGTVDATDFHIDRPFLFLLTEKSTGSVLFMGKVARL